MKSEKIEDVIDSELNRKYNLESGPLMFYTYIKAGKNRNILLISQHHLITDGWSLGILISELNEIYNALSEGREFNLPEISVNTTSFIEWNNKLISDNSIDKEYWIEQMKGDLQVLDLPTDKERPSYQTYNGNTLFFDIDGDLREKLYLFNKNNESTMFITLLTAYYIMLNKLTAQEEIIVGVPVAARDEEESKKLIGMFVNSLPIKANINKTSTVKNLLSNVKEVLLEAYEHESYPFDKLVEDINPERDMSHSPIIQTMFNYLDIPIQINFNNAQASQRIINHKIAKFDLSINISFEYNTDLFEDDTILRWQKYYKRILEQFIKSEEVSISNIELISNEEKSEILSINTKTDYPRNADLVSLFKEVVKVYGGKAAVKLKGKAFTYEQ